MSGGEQQARGADREGERIIHAPKKILLADEPRAPWTRRLPKSCAPGVAMLRPLKKDLGKPHVMITHHSEATPYFDRVWHMRDGAVSWRVPAD